MSRDRRVVIAVASLPKWISDFNVLSSAIAEAGWQTTLLYPKPNGRPDGGWDSERVIAAGEGAIHPAIARRRMPFARNAGRLRIVELLKLSADAAWQALRGAKLFILWSAFPVLMYGPWVRLFNRPCLYLVTGLGMLFADRNKGKAKHRIVCLIYRFLFSSRRALVIVHNHDDKAELVASTGVAAERVIVTGGCGVDPAALPYRARACVNDVPMILVPSRLLRDKGTLDAAAASAILTKAGVRHRMVMTSNPVAGRSDALSAEELRHAAHSASVEFVGYQDDMAPLFAEADIVCIPSWYREGLQTALLEAASAGTPLVACDNVGARDFLRPGVDAIVVPPRDPEALAEGLRQMLADPEMAERMRVSAHRRMMDAFTKQHMLDMTLDGLRGIGFRIGEAGEAAPVSAPEPRTA